MLLLASISCIITTCNLYCNQGGVEKNVLNLLKDLVFCMNSKIKALFDLLVIPFVALPLGAIGNVNQAEIPLLDNDDFFPTVNARTITPQMFGAKGDGKHDDTEAIRKACKSNADTLFFPQGTYIINIRPGKDKSVDNNFFRTNINYIIGESRKSSIIKLGEGNGDADAFRGFEAIFSFSGKAAHPEIRNLTFDFNYDKNPITQYTSNHVDVEHNGQQMAINAYRVSSLIVEDCVFIEHSGTNCIDYRSNTESDTLYCVIRNCDFLKIGKKSFYKGEEAYHDCSTLSLHCDSRPQIKKFICHVENNTFEGVGGNAYDACECSADRFIFRNNKVSGYVVGVMPLTSNPGTVAIIENNIFENVARGVGIWSCNIDVKQEIGSLGFDSILVKNNRIKVNVEKFIRRPQFSTINKKKGDIYPGGFYGAICGMGVFTKSVNMICVEGNHIEYEKIDNVSNEDFTKDVNLFNGAVFGFYNLFPHTTASAYCNEFIFSNNTVGNPVTTIVRLTPFNAIKRFCFNENTITNCWNCSRPELINAGLISVYSACYDGSNTVKWGNFLIRGNNIEFNYDDYKNAIVFLGTSEKQNRETVSSLSILNNIVTPSDTKLVNLKENFFRNVVTR